MQEISQKLQALVPAERANQASMFRALMIEPTEASTGEAFDLLTGRKQ
jgi:hypothetical protein